MAEENHRPVRWYLTLQFEESLTWAAATTLLGWGLLMTSGQSRDPSMASQFGWLALLAPLWVLGVDALPSRRSASLLLQGCALIGVAALALTPQLGPTGTNIAVILCLLASSGLGMTALGYYATHLTYRQQLWFGWLGGFGYAAAQVFSLGALISLAGRQLAAGTAPPTVWVRSVLICVAVLSLLFAWHARSLPLARTQKPTSSCHTSFVGFARRGLNEFTARPGLVALLGILCFVRAAANWANNVSDLHLHTSLVESTSSTVASTVGFLLAIALLTRRDPSRLIVPITVANAGCALLHALSFFIASGERTPDGPLGPLDLAVLTVDGLLTGATFLVTLVLAARALGTGRYAMSHLVIGTGVATAAARLLSELVNVLTERLGPDRTIVLGLVLIAPAIYFAVRTQQQLSPPEHHNRATQPALR